MDGLGGLIRGQWRAYWRGYARAGGRPIGLQGIVLVVTGLVLVKYVHLLGTAGAALAQGNPRPVAWLLAAIFLAWLIYPLCIGRAGFEPRSLLHLPLSRRDLFVLRIGAVLISPLAWLVLAASIAVMQPLVQAPRPWFAVAAGTLILGIAGWAGLALSHLIMVAGWRRLLFLRLFFLSATAAYLFNSGSAARLRYFTSLLHADWVAGVLAGKNPAFVLGLLVVFNAVALAVAWYSFAPSLTRVAQAGSRRRLDGFLFTQPLTEGGLAAKDLRYFRRLLDPYFGFLAGALSSFYLVMSDTPSALVAWVVIVVVFVFNAPLAFNSFGLDQRPGMDRYAMLPVTGAAILRAKNLAFAIYAGIQVAPIILLTGWRIGLGAAAVGLIVAVAASLAYLACGNLMSIMLPSKMHAFRFAPATDTILETLTALVLASSPGVLIIYLARTFPARSVWAIPLVLIGCVALYFFATSHFGQRFTRRRERIVRAIS